MKTTRKYMKKTVECLMLGLLIALPSKIEAQEATGLTLPTPEDRAWMSKNMRITDTVSVNSIGAARVNDEMKAKGLGVLNIQSVPFGEESVELGENASGPTFDALTLPSQVDNSMLASFPPVRNQGSIGSCASFSTVYYMGTHMLNLVRNESADNDGTRLSPRFFYSMVNNGEDSGSFWAPILEIMKTGGAATWQEFPYSGTDWSSWCSDVAVWRQSISRRFNETGTINALDTDEGLTRLKELLTNGYVLVFGADVFSWDRTSTGGRDNGHRVVGINDDPSTVADDSFVGQRVVRFAVPANRFGGHSMTIVGFDDRLWCDVNGNGLVDGGEKGALKICNSWGTDWRNNGFVWLAYDALRSSSAVADGNVAGRVAAISGYGNEAHWITARRSYTPTLVAEFALSHRERGQLRVRLGRGTTTASSPVVTRTPAALQGQGGWLAFDGSTTMTVPYTFAMDLTDLHVTGNNRYFLSVTDSSRTLSANLSAFRLTDALGNQLGGTASGLSSSINNTTQHAWVDYNFSTAPGIISFSPTSGTPGTSVVISGTNLGSATAVRFNGTPSAGFTNNRPTSITAIVPVGATTGQISVVSSSGTGTSTGSFTVTAPPPTISGFNPSSGTVGTNVVISGSGFSGVSALRFNGVNASFSMGSTSQINATVPLNATSGVITVVTSNGTATSSGSFTVTSGSVPANDSFSSGRLIAGATGSATGTNINATKQAGEPNHAGFAGGRSVWFRWVAPSSGTAVFQTVGSNFDTLLGVHTGASVNALTFVAGNDDTNDRTSRVSFVATSGVTYHIAVDGYSAASGTVNLAWTLSVPAPSITSFSPASGPVGANVSISGTNFTGATSVRFNGVSATYTVNSSASISATVPTGATSGPVSVIAAGGTATSSGSFAVLSSGPSNDNFANPAAITGASGFVLGSNVNATFQGGSGEPYHWGTTGGRSVWYSWIAPATGRVTFNTSGSSFDTVLAAYTGSAINALSRRAQDDDGFGANNASLIAFDVTAGNAIRIAVDGYGSNQGDIRLNWNLAASAPPVVSSFTPGTGVAGTSVTITGSGFSGASSVKFNGVGATPFTVNSGTQITAVVPSAATSGRISVTNSVGTGTSVANFNVTVPAPTITSFSPSSGTVGATVTISGTSFVNVTNVRFNNLNANFTVNSASQVVTTVPAGATTGRIQVTTSTGAVNSSGNFTVTAPAPSISSFSPASGPIGTVVNIVGGNFTSVSSVRFNGTACSYTIVSSGQISATVPTGATSGGITVQAAGGTASSAGGFTVTVPSGPANNHFSNAIVLTASGGSVAGNNTGATLEAGEPQHVTASANRSVWYRWTPSVSGVATISTSGNQIDTVLAVYTGSAVNSLGQVASNDDYNGSNASSVTFNASSGVTYRVAVAGYGGQAGVFNLNWQVLANNPPAISGFSPTSGRTGTSITISGSNLSGTNAVFFNGVSANYSVNSSQTITAVAPQGVTTGRVSVRNAYGTATSTANFQVSGPANNNFAAATVLSGSLPATSGSSAGATKESGEPNHAGNSGGASVWFRWVSPSSGTHYVRTAGSNFDTLLAVYTGSSVGSLSLRGSNDDYAGSRTSQVGFNASAGTTYYFAIDGYSGASGTYSLRVSRNAASANLYSTSFESAEGFAINTALVGANGWDGTGTGGNGILDGYIAGEGQHAFVGYSAPDVGDSLLVSREVNHTPDLGDKPLARFSVLMQITDSTNQGYDDFRWTVINKAGVELFSINFDNYGLEVGYTTDANPSAVVPSSLAFENGRTYELQITMNFGTNLWSATLDGAVVALNKSITTLGSGLDLGKIDATWIPQVTGFSGDNRMVFDNYKIDTEASTALAFDGQMSNVIVIEGDDIMLPASVEGNPGTTYQWQFNGVNIAGQTDPVLLVEDAMMTHAGRYTLEATDGVSTLTSNEVIVIVARHANEAFNDWLTRLFDDSVPATVAGRDADPDGDNRSNFHEYAFGGNPFSNVQSGDLRISSNGEFCEFERLMKPDGVQYTVETSSDLESWTIDSTPPVRVESSLTPEGYETVKVPMPASSAGKAFIRVRAALAE